MLFRYRPKLCVNAKIPIIQVDYDKQVRKQYAHKIPDNLYQRDRFQRAL